MIVNKKIKATTIVVAITIVVWKYQTYKSTLEKTTDFISSYHETVMERFQLEIDTVIGITNYDNMVSEISNDLSIYEDTMSSVPTLINTNTETLVSNLEDRFNSTALPIIQTFIEDKEVAMYERIPSILDDILSGMDREFSELSESLISSDDTTTMIEFYNKMTLEMRVRFLGEIRATFSADTDERINRVQEFYSAAITGSLLMYQEFIEKAKKMSLMFSGNDQAENYIRSIAQTRISETIVNNLKYSMLTDYANGTMTDDEMTIFLEEFFASASVIRNFMHDEIVFRSDNGHVPSILVDRASQLYLNSFDSNSSNKIVSDSQRRSLNNYAKVLYDQLMVYFATTSSVQTYTFESLKGFSDTYLFSILPKVYTYIYAMFVEFKNVLQRSLLEGSQTCILQFFEMRRVLDFEFFFAVCQEQDFDLVETESVYRELYDEQLATARSRMIGYARLPYIMYLYEDSIDFLGVSSELLFFTDDDLRAVIDEITETFHDKMASSVTDFLDLGIESIYEEESSSSSVIIESTFELFKKNMEFMKASHLVNELSSIVKLEISQKINFVTDLIPDLVDEFKGEVTEPFSNEWMEATKQSFLIGDDIDFDGMKRFVVEEMNVVGKTVTEDYVQTITEYVDEQIVGISVTLGEVSLDISASISESPITDDDKIIVNNSLSSTIEDLEGTISSVKTSLLVNINDILQSSIRSLDQVMDINTQNFFNTSIREVVEVFQSSVGEDFTGLYYVHIDMMSAAYKIIANQAKSIFESRVRRIINLEVEYRGKIEEETGRLLGIMSDEIIEDYDIISYTSRRTILVNNMRVKVIEGVLSLRMQRNAAIKQEEREYAVETAQFQNTYSELSKELVDNFTADYSAMITATYEKAADVLSMVSSVLSVLEGDLKLSLTESYSDLVEQVVFSETNDLPSIGMLSISYPQGIMAVSDPIEGDLPSIMNDSLIITDLETVGGSEFLDETQITTTALQVDESLDNLGASGDGSIDHIQISLSMSDYTAWEKNLVETAIEDLEVEMTQSLKENTCPNKPTCKVLNKDGECDSFECRDGYILGVNSHGIKCCLWDPVGAGFPFSAIGAMLLEELALMYFTSPTAFGHVAKLSRFMAKGVSKVASKSAAKFLKVTAKFSGKASGAFAKVGGRMGKKLAIKTGRKAGMKLSSKVLSKTLSKIVFKVGAKIASKVGVKVGKAVASAALKSLIKIGSSGPIGVALVVFDLLSLALDLWDPAGYNDAQAAGQIAATRDSIETYYNETLKADGITSPLLPDPMYNVDPAKQGELVEELMMQWFSDSILAHTSANEERWQYMPISESTAEQNAEVDRLTEFIFSDLNFMEELTCKNTENTFLVKASKVNGLLPSMRGTPQDKDYDETTKTHRRICVLNETGVNLHNSFSKQKVEFVNDIVKDPLYRWSKISDEGGYTIYSEITSAELKIAKDEKNRRQGEIDKGKTLSTSELNAPLITKFGWSLIIVDAEEEFWKQYVYSQEEGTDIPERKNFGNAWKSDEDTNRQHYLGIIEAVMEESIADMVPCDEETGKCEGMASIEMIKNKDSESPSWYPEYDDLYDSSKSLVDENILENLKDKLDIAKQNEAILEVLNNSMDEQTAEELGISVKQAKKDRISESFNVEGNLQEADFAVMKGGFSRMSPLSSIKETCDEMGHGVSFDQGKGLCNFTQKYCDRYGLTYFFNEDVNVYDCKLATSQKVFESIFGTTITRSIKRGAKALAPEGSLGALGAAGEVIDLELEKNIPALSIMDGLDSLGLGSKYSIW